MAGFSSFVLGAQPFQPALGHSLERLCYYRIYFSPSVFICRSNQPWEVTFLCKCLFGEGEKSGCMKIFIASA